jgi:hypothetical protein
MLTSFEQVNGKSVNWVKKQERKNRAEDKKCMKADERKTLGKVEDIEAEQKVGE